MNYFLKLTLISTLLCGIVTAETLAEAPKSLPVTLLLFQNKKVVIGKLKMEQQTEQQVDQVRVEFEGHDLPTGKYKIIKVENCSVFKKKIKEKEILKELLSFETKYGNISTEKMINNTTLEELNINEINIALAKVSKGKLTTIYCSN